MMCTYSVGTVVIHKNKEACAESIYDALLRPADASVATIKCCNPSK